MHNIFLIELNSNFLKSALFPSTVIKRNNLDPVLSNSKDFLLFKTKILKDVRPSANSIYDSCIYNRLKPIKG